MGKRAKHYFANRASGTAGQGAKRNQAAVEQAAQQVAQTKVRTTKATTIHLAGNSQKHRTLLDIRDGHLRVGESVLVQDLQLQVVAGDRVAIAGANGSDAERSQGLRQSRGAASLLLELTRLKIHFVCPQNSTNKP